MSLPTCNSPVIDLWTFLWIIQLLPYPLSVFSFPAPIVLTSFQIKVVMNHHRQNFNSHISNQKHVCTNGWKQNKSTYNICRTHIRAHAHTHTHTHTHTHKTDFSIVDADKDASELKISPNSCRDKRVLVFNENILRYLFTWYTEHSTEHV